MPILYGEPCAADREVTASEALESVLAAAAERGAMRSAVAVLESLCRLAEHPGALH